MEKIMLEYLEKNDYKYLSNDDENFYIKNIGIQKLNKYLKSKEAKKIKEKIAKGMSEDEILKKIKAYKQKYNKREHFNAFVEIKAIEYVFNTDGLTSEDFFDWIYSLNLNREEIKEIDLAIYFYESIKLFKLAVDGANENELNNEKDYIKGIIEF